MSTIINKPTVKIDEEILQYLQTEETRTTIVHCRIYSPFPTLARIWPTTYLIEESGRKVRLIKAFHIAISPDWTCFFPEDGFVCFTLLFEGLSNACSLFYLLEDISEPGGFYSGKIERNRSDVYVAELSF